MGLKQDYLYSTDKSGLLIKVTDAVKGIDYYCPCCGGIMIPRQGSIRRWHFAHKSDPENCSYESYLHSVAKKRICECFNKTPHFTISFYPKTTCAIKECPLGTKQPCTWTSKKSFDLKKYYDYCQRDVNIDGCRADLLISNHKNNTAPILINLYMTEKLTEEKLNSSHRIIEIHIESEEDIEQIVRTASINECNVDENHWLGKKDNKIRFYNFKANTFEVPDSLHQAYKFRFWIDSKGYFHFDGIDDFDGKVKCLSQNPAEIDNSTFRIESRAPIDWDFAFRKLSESGLGIRYCTMCRFYRLNDYYGTSMCILYKSKGTKKFPALSIATNCVHFKQIDYLKDNRLFGVNYNPEYKVSIKR